MHAKKYRCYSAADIIGMCTAFDKQCMKALSSASNCNPDECTATWCY